MELTKFKGLMVPVFTPFESVGNEVNYKVIPKYAEILQSKNIKGILVNGTTGEGTSLNLEERKKVTEEWLKSCKKYEMILMVQISGCSFTDTVELARHAELLGVHGVLCLPELYFKPKTPEQLVKYLKDIAIHCSKTPLYYYHIPKITQVDVSMPIFMELAKNEIKNFAGIKFSSGDLSVGVECLKFGQVFLGTNMILCGALALGFDCAIMTPLNICPESSFDIIKLMENGNVKAARNEQLKLNQYIGEILRNGSGDWVQSMKKAFNEIFGESIDLGDVRKPL